MKTKNKQKKNKVKIPDGWEVKKLGEISEIYDGTHQTPKYKEAGIPFLSVEHITANQFSDTKFISKEVYKKEIEKVVGKFFRKNKNYSKRVVNVDWGHPNPLLKLYLIMIKKTSREWITKKCK